MSRKEVWKFRIDFYKKFLRQLNFNIIPLIILFLMALGILLNDIGKSPQPILFAINQLLIGFVIFVFVMVILTTIEILKNKDYSLIPIFLLKNKYLKKIMTKHYQKKYKIIDTNFTYYLFGSRKSVDVEYINDCLSELNQLPKDIQLILRKYDVPIFFINSECMKGGNITFGSYNILMENPLTSRIYIYKNNFSTFTSADVVLHEISHHLDMVSSYELLPIKRFKINQRNFFSCRVKEFEYFYNHSIIDMDNYFYSNISEFYAETLKMYLMGELEEEYSELHNYYEDHIHQVVKKIYS